MALVSLAALAASMLVAVRRSAEVREIGGEVERLEARAAEMEERRSRAARAADSLSSRRRILGVASTLGFHVPPDSVVHTTPDVAPAEAREGS